MTLNEALILSYIKRGIGYGYNILSHVRESGSDEWVEFSRAGLYKTLDKMEREGYLRKKLASKGNRPPKKMYTITEDGVQALQEFLLDGFNFNFHSKYELDAYLVTAVAAYPDASSLRTSIEKRIESVNGQLDILHNEWPEDKSKYSLIVYSLYQHRIKALETELSWLTWFSGVLKGIDGDILHLTWGDVES